MINYYIPIFKGASWILKIVPNIVSNSEQHYKFIVERRKHLHTQHSLYTQRQVAQNISFKQWQNNKAPFRNLVLIQSGLVRLVSKVTNRSDRFGLVGHKSCVWDKIIVQQY